MQPYIRHPTSHRSPPNQQKLSHQPLPPHGHQYPSHRHALAEAGHHPGLGQVASQLLQQLVKVLLPCVAVYLIGVGDADPLLCCHVFKSLHTALAVVPYGGGNMNGMVFMHPRHSGARKTWGLVT